MREDEKLVVAIERDLGDCAVIVSYRDQIIAAFDAGGSLRTIWEVLHEDGQVTMPFDCFRRRCAALSLLPTSEHLRRTVAKGFARGFSVHDLWTLHYEEGQTELSFAEFGQWCQDTGLGVPAGSLN